MVTFPAPDSAKVEPSRPDLSPRANICFPGPVAVGNLPAMLPPIQSCENRSAVNLRGLSINRKGPLTAGTLLVAGAGWRYAVLILIALRHNRESDLSRLLTPRVNSSVLKASAHIAASLIPSYSGFHVIVICLTSAV